MRGTGGREEGDRVPDGNVPNNVRRICRCTVARQLRVHTWLGGGEQPFGAREPPRNKGAGQYVFLRGHKTGEFNVLSADR